MRCFACGLIQIPGQLRLQVRPEVMQQHKAPPEDARRHHHVGVHGPVRNPEPPASIRRQRSGSRQGFSSPISSAARTSSRNSSSLRGRPAHDESQLARRRVFGHVAQPLLQKVIVPQVGVGIVGNHLEIHHNRHAQQIRRLQSPHRARGCPQCASPAASNRQRMRRPCAAHRLAAPARAAALRSRKSSSGFFVPAALELKGNRPLLLFSMAGCARFIPVFAGLKKCLSPFDTARLNWPIAADLPPAFLKLDQPMFFKASRMLRALRRTRLRSTYFLTSSASVQACWRSAQPIALRRKNSRDSSDGSMQA